MASGRFGAVARQVQRLFDNGTVAGLNEGQLLERFRARRDEAAFEALVVRFGPMVRGICRALLDDPHDADDAFQATFLVLVKKAGAIRDQALVGNWLYGVAHRVALRSRAESARRRRRESAREGLDVADPASGPPRFDDDLRPLLHEEVARLPSKYRKPVVLCYLQGQTHEEAARNLGWPVGTVKGRLSRARRLLRDRLIRRGVAPTAGILATALAREAGAAVPDILVRNTVHTGMALAAGKTVAAGAVSASAVSLMERVVNAMWLAKLKLVAAGLVAAGVVAAGAGVSGQYLGAGQEPPPAPEGNPASDGPRDNSRPDEAKVGEPVDPPPISPEPVPVLGVVDPPPISPETVRVLANPPVVSLEPEPVLGARKGGEPQKQAFKKIEQRMPEPIGPHSIEGLDPIAAERLKAAVQFAEATRAFYEQGTITIDRYISASQRLMEAQTELVPTPAERREAIEAHVARMKALESREKAKHENGAGSIPNVAEASLAVAEAEYRLHHANQSDETPASVEGGATASPHPALPENPAPQLETTDLPPVSPRTRQAPRALGDPQLETNDLPPISHIPIPAGVEGGATASLRPALHPQLETTGLPPISPASRLEKQEPSGTEIGAMPTPGDRPGDDGPRSRLILTELEKPIVMPFGNETPLEDVIKYIKTATQSADLPDGIPIYIDPAGLNEAEKTLTSPITLELEGVPLKYTLQLLLKQLDLAYGIKDGLMIISYPGPQLNELLLAQPIYEPSEFERLEYRASHGEISPEELKRLETLWKLIGSPWNQSETPSMPGMMRGRTGIDRPNPSNKNQK